MSYCGNCGTKLAETDNFCPECGERCAEPAAQAQMRPKTPKAGSVARIKTEPGVTQAPAEWLSRVDKRLLIYLVLAAIGLVGMMAGQGGLFVLFFLCGGVLFVGRTAELHWHILGREQIVDQWNPPLFEAAAGEAAHVVENTERRLAQIKAPGVEWELRDISPGVVRGLLGVRRPFLVVFNTSNPNLRPFKMYIDSRPYGTSLQVCWYLVQQPSLWHKMVIFLLCVPIVGLLVFPLYFLSRLSTAKQAGVLGLDVFDEEDLRAYVTVGHHCLLHTVDKLMLDLSQDPSTINRCSRGFLGIS